MVLVIDASVAIARTRRGAVSGDALLFRLRNAGRERIVPADERSVGPAEDLRARYELAGGGRVAAHRLGVGEADAAPMPPASGHEPPPAGRCGAPIRGPGNSALQIRPPPRMNWPVRMRSMAYSGSGTAAMHIPSNLTPDHE